jgi:plastocyanin
MRGSRPMALGGLLAALVLVLAACGGGAVSSAAEGDAAGGDSGDSGETVSLSGGRFSPSSLAIPAGTTVTFTDTTGHTVTEGSDGEAVDDPIVDEEGGSDPIEVSFEEAGTFDITCRIHPGMNMTITVEG